MTAKYIYRMDDITPDMNWDSFWKYIDLFKMYKVTPLLGIVPDNRDPDLSCQRERHDFWQIMRDLKSSDTVEFAQHGFQHVYVSWEEGILSRKYGFKQQSEFAGLTYNEQFEKIKTGRDILRNHGIFTDVWMAPSHSFDLITLKVLEDLGFSTLTDGIALYPFMISSLTAIPQQQWEPEYYPLGIVTICLHINHSSESLYQKVEKHLKSGACFIKFSEAKKYKAGKINKLVNYIYKPCFRVRNSINFRGRAAKAGRCLKSLTGAFIHLFGTDKKE